MKLIDKNEVIAEILKLRKENESKHGWHFDEFNEGYLYALDDIENSLNDSEVKEVDLENEVESEYNPINGLSFEEYSSIAKHFFELGLKAGNSVSNKTQKGE